MRESTGIHQGAQDAQHTIAQSITLHLLPGILFLPVFALVSPLSDNLGLPKHLAPMLITFLLAVIPFELGYLLYQGKKQNGRFSLQGVILYRQPMPWRQYVVLGAPLLIWAAFVFMVIAPPVDAFFIDRFFSWMPDGYFQSTLINSLDAYSQASLLATGIGMVVLIGFVGPVVEELYFRGYLLPRMPGRGLWSPSLHILLFSLYHLWSPWQNLVRIIAMSPLYYAVWWKRNIYLGIVWHVVANVLSALLVLAVILGAT